MVFMSGGTGRERPGSRPTAYPMTEPKPRMRVWTTTRFTGHWPVGTSAVVVAKSRPQAVKLLEARLKDDGLEQKVEPGWLVELNMESPEAIVLCDGNY